MKTKAWITWESQPRNKSMARVMGADYYEFNHSGGRFARYWHCIRDTVKVFSKDYDVIFVQNPSIVLSFLATILSVHNVLVIDAHNAGVYPRRGLRFINKYILHCADIVIVTNEALAKKVGNHAFVMSDPLPDYSDFTPTPINEDYILIVCSWSDDEPIDEYMKLAMFSDYNIKITGKYPTHITPMSNVELLGYVSEQEYLNYLHNASVVIDLTTRDNCLVCGAYEAISAGVPVIVTDNKTNRETFSRAVYYSPCDWLYLRDSIEYAISDKNKVIDYFRTSYNELTLERASVIDKLTDDMLEDKMHSMDW